VKQLSKSVLRVKTDLGTDSILHPDHLRSARCRSICVDLYWSMVSVINIDGCLLSSMMVVALHAYLLAPRCTGVIDHTTVGLDYQLTNCHHLLLETGHI